MTNPELYSNTPEAQNLENTDRFSKELSKRVDRYIDNSKDGENLTLRPHQLDVFEDLRDFFAEDKRRGYIELPTGTGKTVLFVELAKAILGESTEDDIKPRILVVTPTKDLVHQTIGRKGKRGFGRFAPELNVGSYFSDSTDKEKAQVGEYDVVVTTYNSLARLNFSKAFKNIDDFQRDVLESSFFRDMVQKTGYNKALAMAREFKSIPAEQSNLDKFNIVFFDEAHHVMGDQTRKIVQGMSDDKRIIGFTATPDATEIRKLIKILPEEIHRMGFLEAISWNLVSPVVAFGIQSDSSIKGSNIFDEDGEYMDAKISYLAQNETRNERIIKAARIFADRNIGTIISCIGGNNAWHARHLAELSNEAGMRAVAVYSGIPSVERKLIYEEFEEGNIDTLTFIGVLGEGWDSNRAKALINARPSRSKIFTRQRIGRTTRPGNPSFIVDICDRYDEMNPPITAADVLESEAIQFGEIIGSTEQEQQVNGVLNDLRENIPVTLQLKGEHTFIEGVMADLPRFKNGKLVDPNDTSVFMLPTMASISHSGITDEVVQKLEDQTGLTVDKKSGVSGRVIRTAYNRDQLQVLLKEIREIDPKKYYNDNTGLKWISGEGLLTLFGKRYPNLTKEDIDFAILGTNTEWIVGSRIRSTGSPYRFIEVFKMYKATQELIEQLDTSFKKRFKD